MAASKQRVACLAVAQRGQGTPGAALDPREGLMETRLDGPWPPAGRLRNQRQRQEKLEHVRPSRDAEGGRLLGVGDRDQADAAGLAAPSAGMPPLDLLPFRQGDHDAHGVVARLDLGAPVPPTADGEHGAGAPRRRGGEIRLPERLGGFVERLHAAALSQATPEGNAPEAAPSGLFAPWTHPFAALPTGGRRRTCCQPVFVWRLKAIPLVPWPRNVRMERSNGTRVAWLRGSAFGQAR